MKREMFINIIKSPLCYHSDDEFPWCKYADSVALWVSGGGGAVETLSTFSNIHNILPPDHHDHHYHTAAGESWAHLKTVGTNLLFSNFSLSVERLSVRDRGLDDNDHEHDDDIADDVDDAYDLTMDFTLLEKEGRPQRELMGEMEVFQTWQCHWCWCCHIHSKSEYRDPNDPAKKFELSSNLSKNATKWPKNDPKWPKYGPKWP